MNQSNHAENLFHSWKLRPPADKIAQNLFPPAAKPMEKASWPSWNWLAPLAVCAFTLLVTLSSRPHAPSHLNVPDTNLFFASITMNNLSSSNGGTWGKSAFALSKADVNLEQNVWREATFESTNLGQTHSSMASLPLGKTNSLMR